jgi:Flp pilus assembly protein TadB
MEQHLIGLYGALGTLAFFAFLAFAVWLDYRKKKDERDAAHEERMKALELGYAPLDAEIERAKAYASAAWAAGLIGLLVPLALVLLTGGCTLVIVLTRGGEGLFVPLIVAWSIAGLLALLTILRSLSVIRHLPRPGGDLPQKAPEEKPKAVSSVHVQEKPAEV